VLKVLFYEIKWTSSMPLDEGENQLMLALPELSARKEQIDDQMRQVIKRTTATVRCNTVYSL
jgi:prefoldin subunit 5